MKKICVINNVAPLYREPIFRLIDKEWNTVWYFGRPKTKFECITESALSNTHYVDNVRFCGGIWWQKNISGVIREPDIQQYIMAGNPKWLSTWWILLLRRLFYRNKRIYLWTHGWYGRENIITKWIKRFYFGLADHILTYGDYARQQAIAQGFCARKVTTIHNSLDHEHQTQIRARLQRSEILSAHFSNDFQCLLFVGRLNKVKRLDLVISALALLKDRGVILNFVLIGDGEDERRLKNLSTQLGVANQIWFYGACYDDDEIAAIIYNADLCVAPGNVGLTAIHTMVFGTPVLTHNDFRWQMPEFEAILEGRTGAFFQKDDVESLANAIELWFEQHPDREHVRAECMKEIDNNWTPQFQLSVLRGLLNGTNE